MNRVACFLFPLTLLFSALMLLVLSGHSSQSKRPAFHVWGVKSDRLPASPERNVVCRQPTSNSCHRHRLGAQRGHVTNRHRQPAWVVEEGVVVGRQGQNLRSRTPSSKILERPPNLFSSNLHPSSATSYKLMLSCLDSQRQPRYNDFTKRPSRYISLHSNKLPSIHGHRTMLFPHSWRY